MVFAWLAFELSIVELPKSTFSASIRSITNVL
jgi:hypothetical protein